MERLNVEIPISGESISYPIWIGSGVLSRLSELLPLKPFSSIAIIVDSNVAPHWLPALKKGCLDHRTDIIFVPPGENSKSANSATRIWQELAASNLDRFSLVLNLGGGVITDLGGFVASTYLRGVPFVQIPTTLLSQVDASVGGKTGINLDDIKNVVGTFAQPIGVLIDIDTLTTLGDREYIAGFAEVLKHGLIQDRSYFDFVCSKAPRAFSKDDMIRIIRESCEIKSSIVTQDEREGGLRKILNFGHTFGHAIETLSFETEQPLLHGEAISIGMVAETKLAEILGRITKDELLLIENALSSSGLPIRSTFKLLNEPLFAALNHDKKKRDGQIQWSLLSKIGRCDFDIVASEKQVIEALEYVQPN